MNYTTTIAPEKSAAEILGILARGGARSISIDYDGQGNPIGVAFAAQTAIGEHWFRLPANSEGVWKTLVRQGDRGQVPRRYMTREHASRVAWRILKDWTEAQMAIIQSGLATLDQVMLPYLLVTPQLTLHEAFISRQLALPEGREGTNG